MKMSEQAAFVKEVIMQEAIRAARREGKSVDEVLGALQKEATQKLAGEEARDAAVEEEEVLVAVIQERQVFDKFSGIGSYPRYPTEYPSGIYCDLHDRASRSSSIGCAARIGSRRTDFVFSSP